MICKKCGEDKDPDAFYSYRPSRCKNCINAYVRNKYYSDVEASRKVSSERSRRRYQALAPDKKAELLNKNKVKRRRKSHQYRLSQHYGMTVEEFDRKLEAQNYRCPICDTDDPGHFGWNVDHDHATGVIRDLLCRTCNLGLGRFKDSVELCRRAAKYLDCVGNVEF